MNFALITLFSFMYGHFPLNTNRKFVGIELDEDYFNIAVERLKNIMFRIKIV